VAAFEKKTGNLVWKSAENYGAGYASPVAFDLNGKRCVAVFNAYGLVVLSVADGKELSKFPWDTSYEVNAATPLINGNEVFISSGYDRGAALLRLGGQNPQVVWENRNMRNHFNTCVVWNGHIYGFDDNKLACLDYKTGNALWSRPGLGKGSLTLADGKLIILSERGELVTAEADPAGFREISRAHVLGGKCWTAPVLYGGKIFCRNAQGDLVCLDVRAG
jgi:outer membrane protein assembly factor BamB